MIAAGVAMEEVDQRLEAMLSERVEQAERAGPAYQRLWMRIRSAVRGGKRIRPQLLLMAHAEISGTRVEDAVTAAAAFELLHTALLIHDDMLDRDLVRRGATNLQGDFLAQALETDGSFQAATAWSDAAGLLAGDLLISAAHALVGEITAPAGAALRSLLDECLFVTAAGELADIGLAVGVLDRSVDGIMQMMRDKTAAYSFAAPLRAAAMLAGSGPEFDADLAEIGTRLGFVYQLRDDLLGVFGSEEALGKSVDSDLRAGKSTLLVAYADGTDAWEEVRHLFGRRSADADDVHRMRDALVASGARSRAEELLDQQRVACVDHIGRSDLPSGLRGALTRLTHRCAERES
ncbi:polyprenyl synthetase family protein [Microbacterium indicum]|uniref:polyprenyl synthetase family protein n=1 Tax=Microbacterium indicum TaxID=358100 RepID=UPI0006882BB3|nr:polyprenyl synthetase family protein [Microbacterium indicum]